MSDPFSAFLGAMAAAGIRTPDKLTGDGKLQRFYVEGDRKGTKNGFLTFHSDAPESGHFGSYRLGISQSWTIDKPERMTPEERNVLRERMERSKQEREAVTARAHEMARSAAAAILAACGPADADHPYLVAKGIAGLPNARQLKTDVRYEVADDERPKRTAKAGVLVNPIKGPDGTLHSVQTIAPDGTKHFIKGTNKAGHYHSIGKLTPTIVIAEGFSTAGTIHKATGLCTVIAFDSGNLMAVAKAIKRKYPAHEIVMGADNDRLTMKPVPNPGMTKACEAAATVDGLVAWPEFEREAELPGGGTPTDFNDLAALRGNLESVAACFAAAQRPEDIENHTDPRRHVERPNDVPVLPEPKLPRSPELSEVLALKLRSQGFDRGSEVEIARAFHDVVLRDLGSLIYAEGEFWSFDGRCWRPIDRDHMRRTIHILDGADIDGGGRSGKVLKLSSRMIDGILRELAVTAGDPHFFDTPAQGIPAKNCLITFAPDGRVVTVPHAPDHRRRFVIDADFDVLLTPTDPPPGSLLQRLFAGAFHDDHDAPDKVRLIAEALGAAAAGMATRVAQPKALILFGATASNGKSSIAALFAALLPQGATCSISPSAMSDERRVVHLAGCAANVADELGGASVAGEALKAAVTGDPMTGRDVRASAVTFRPAAFHCFTTNALPRFGGGLDRGLQRRLVVVPFSRPIPKGEIIAGIAERIASEELENLLGLAVMGAARLVKNKVYTEPHSSKTALAEWLHDEPMQEWAVARLKVVETPPAGGWMKVSALRDDFKRWSVDEGYRENAVIDPGQFKKKLETVKGVRELPRHASGRIAVGVVLADSYP
ncbi:MAG: hypothetical protein K2Z25_15390 [Beijerinckiaceae bacterium]|nr:hypothetical protein [Beijerinckiaceae bacterium]